jgi:hypothetical protein
MDYRVIHHTPSTPPPVETAEQSSEPSGLQTLRQGVVDGFLELPTHFQPIMRFLRELREHPLRVVAHRVTPDTPRHFAISA